MKDLQVKREWATAIALQCLRMNSIGDEMREGIGPAVFFELHGHTGSIQITVNENGWDRDDENYPDFNRTLYSFSDIKEYIECMDYLKSLEVEKC